MSGWVWWVLAAVALTIGEITIMGFFLGPFALGALAALVAALVGAGAAIQVALFLGASGAAFALVRPIARRHLHTPPQIRTGTAALVGRPAVVLERIANMEASGSVRIDGEVWTARAYLEDDVIEPGTKVQVVEIRGATALVAE